MLLDGLKEGSLEAYGAIVVAAMQDGPFNAFHFLLVDEDAERHVQGLAPLGGGLDGQFLFGFLEDLVVELGATGFDGVAFAVVISVDEVEHVLGGEDHVEDELQVDCLENADIGCLHVEVLEI